MAEDIAKRAGRSRPVESTVWWASAPSGPPCPALDTDIEVDVAIVGAGFVGLTAAHALARSGLSVVVLEAGEAGEGASGLNAGFVVPNFAKADPDAVMARLGDEAGLRLLGAVGASADAVFETIRTHAIACEGEQVGWMHVAHTPDMAEVLRRRAEQWRRLGRPLSFLPAADAREWTGMRTCHGALLDRSGGMLNPLAFARGLARRAIEAGAIVRGWTPVTAIEREKDRWRLQAGGHQVRASRVALCTNAFMTGAAAKLGGAVIPLGVYQIATEPLPPDVAARVSPKRIPMADTRANLFTARLTADDRLVSGGMSIMPLGAEDRMARSIAGRLAREFDLDRPPAVAFLWRGTAAMTPDFLPRILHFADGLYGAIGCNGRGVALTHVVAHALAGILGDEGTQSAIPVVSGEAIPFRILAPLATALAVLQVRLKDALAVE